MILENKGVVVKIPFNAKEYEIPEGKFEVEEKLGNHILSIAKKWGNKEIVIIDKQTNVGIKPEVKPEIIPEAPKTEIPEGDEISDEDEE